MSAGMGLGAVNWTGAIVVGLAAVAIEAVALVLALRAEARLRGLERRLAAGEWSTRPPSPPPMTAFAISAALPPLLVLGRMVYEVQRARATILESVSTFDLGRNATMASAGLLGELAAILAGTLGLALPLVLGAVTVGVAGSARARRLGFGWAIELLTSDHEAALAWRERPGLSAPVLTAVILGFVLFGLGPVIGGAVVGTWFKLEAVDVMARAAPDAKLAIYAQAQSEAGQIFESGYLATMVGVVCVAIGSAILLWLTWPSRARRRILGRPAPMPPSSDGGIIGATAMVVAAIGLVVVASPMRRENRTPWPNGSATERLGVETVALEGPDPLVLAPMIALTKSGLAFEREATDMAGVGDRLLTYRANFPLLHPGEPPPREVLLACSPELASERVFALLETARRSGYDRVRLIFETALTAVRPAIGPVKLRNVTAAQVAIGDEGAPQVGAQPVRAGDTATCAQLAARVVDLRRAGRPVILVSRPSPI